MKQVTFSHSHGFNCAIIDDYDGFDITYKPVISSEQNDELAEDFTDYIEASIIAAYEVNRKDKKFIESIKNYVASAEVNVGFEPDIFEDTPDRANGTRRIDVTLNVNFPFSDVLTDYMEGNPYRESNWPQGQVVFADQEFTATPPNLTPFEHQVIDVLSDIEESFNNLFDSVSPEQLYRIISDEFSESFGITGLEDRLASVTKKKSLNVDLLSDEMCRAIMIDALDKITPDTPEQAVKQTIKTTPDEKNTPHGRTPKI
ncbi:hypothetical protein [Alteromonas sp. 14N.309.X.WAT.G.H12]|uniref:hypothetical protein n=1 Tax=Alteromonas sp. 14N.309.X.WAT.G.H12 TaxID=3120824 RepID=UPI002FD4A1E9